MTHDLQSSPLNLMRYRTTAISFGTGHVMGKTTSSGILTGTGESLDKQIQRHLAPLFPDVQLDIEVCPTPY